MIVYIKLLFCTFGCMGPVVDFRIPIGILHSLLVETPLFRMHGVKPMALITLHIILFPRAPSVMSNMWLKSQDYHQFVLCHLYLSFLIRLGNVDLGYLTFVWVIFYIVSCTGAAPPIS